MSVRKARDSLRRDLFYKKRYPLGTMEILYLGTILVYANVQKMIKNKPQKWG